MKRRILLLSVFAAFFISTSVVFAADRLVPSVYATIQAGIDAAMAGDTVIVEPNIYTGTGNKNLDFDGEAITVRSTNPNDPLVVASTVIDCENSGRGFYFHSGEGPNSVISGLTITNGYVYDANGGGIYCSGSSPTIRNCTITGNRADGRNGNGCGSGDPGCELRVFTGLYRGKRADS